MAPLAFNGRKVLYAMFPVLIIYAVLMFVDVFFLDSSNTMLATFRLSFGASSGAIRALDVGKGVLKKWRWFLPLYILIVVLTPVLAIPFILYDLIMILYAILYWFGYKSFEKRVRLVSIKPRLTGVEGGKGKGREQQGGPIVHLKGPGEVHVSSPIISSLDHLDREDNGNDSDAPFR